MNLNEQLNKAIKLLNNNDFVKAHDIFELLWRELKNNSITREESFILKGFISASISIELYDMKRIEHSINVWKTYEKYEYLIDSIVSLNTDKYKKIRILINKKREEFIK